MMKTKGLFLFAAMIFILFVILFSGTMNIRTVLTNGKWISEPIHTEWGHLILGHIFFDDHTVLLVDMPEAFESFENVPENAVKGVWKIAGNKILIDYGKPPYAYGRLSRINRSYVLTIDSGDDVIVLHRKPMIQSEKKMFGLYSSIQEGGSTNHTDSETNVLICASFQNLLSEDEKALVLHTMKNIHQAKTIWAMSAGRDSNRAEPNWDNLRDYLGVTGSIDSLPAPCGGIYIIGEIGIPVSYVPKETRDDRVKPHLSPTEDGKE